MGEEKILWLEKTTSTNDIAKQYMHKQQGFCVAAGFQESGRGQAGNSWESDPESNLLASFIFSTRINATESFAISMIASLAVYRFILSYGCKAEIKWPNDIIAGNKKIAGILIENSIMGEIVDHTIIGVGVNLNQKEFAGVPNATSLGMLTNHYFEPESMALELQRFMLMAFEEFSEPTNLLREMYFSLLFRKEGATYVDSNSEFQAMITDVGFDGRLTLQKETGITESYYFKEVQMKI